MNSSKLRVSVIGLGYIGLPTAAVLASVGHVVIGVDISPHIVETVNRGDIHIVEPDLEELVHGAVLSGRLRAVLVTEAADVFMIAVPTPFMSDRQPDLSYVQKAARMIAPHLRPGNLVILESTSPVGSTEKLAEWLSAERPDLKFPSNSGAAPPDIHLAYCPERVLPGRIVAELVKNDRVIGGLTSACSARARVIYETFVSGSCVVTDARTAEMTKLTENAFRDVNIAFANELSLICDELQINVWELIRLANRHPRVSILNPGPGVGGHCIAVDPWFIIDSAPNSSRLIRAAREVNDSKPAWVLGKIAAAISARHREGLRARVACLGLAFKADVDDLRESPALEIVERVHESMVVDGLLVVDPYVDELPVTFGSEVRLIGLDEAISEADILVLLVDHQEFKCIDRERLCGKFIIDTRGIWA